ncbi:MAG: HAMP domain-containing histidine kinase [Chloroflexi bacterium]|nr:HAMP domain-containing histidine kinase [Chloroflexota bacterium]
MSAALEQAQTLLDELVQAAHTGRIIPVRLPGQLEAIQALLEQARADQAAAEAQANSQAAPPEIEEFLQEQSAFMSHAVHELRTPMTSIRGYTDMLVMAGAGELDDMQKQFVETIRTNARRMEGLLKDVSDINKIRAGTLRINEKMDMFKNIVQMVEKEGQPLAEQLGRTLTFDIPQGLPILNVDGEFFAKALMKLVENGLRYQEGPGGEVIVRGAADGNTLVATVEDTGIGMTPDELDRLGEIYFRGEHEVVLSYKGSGLGIPVAYGVIRALGGSISVASTPGAGTTFTIMLEGMS